MGDVDDSNAGFAALQGKENCVYFLVWIIPVGGGIGKYCCEIGRMRLFGF